MVQAGIFLVIKLNFFLLKLSFQPGDILAGYDIFIAHDHSKIT